jgi:hypothetical protein
MEIAISGRIKYDVQLPGVQGRGSNFQEIKRIGEFQYSSVCGGFYRAIIPSFLFLAK